jgi:drug/metabolite transporter (DMT)-like permease
VKHHGLGIALGVLSGFFYACLVVIYKLLDRIPKLMVGMKNFWRYGISMVLLVPWMWHEGIRMPSVESFAVLGAFGLLFAVIASGIHILGMGRTKCIHATIVGKAEPVFAIAFAAVAFGEKVTPAVWVGGALVIGSSLWLVIRSKAKIFA